MKSISFSESMQNLKRNWYFPISAAAFFCLTIDETLGYFISAAIALCAILIISSRISSIKEIAADHPVYMKILCCASALGVCLASQEHFQRKASILVSKLSLSENLSTALSFAGYIGVACAIFFVYFCLALFWKKLKQIFTDTGLLCGLKPAELVVYALLAVIFTVLSVIFFLSSRVPYGVELTNDIFYTSDSWLLVRNNAFLVLSHPENDLRQPLFAVFSAPFTSIPYLLGRLCGASEAVQTALLNVSQVVIMLASNFILAKMMKLSDIKRVSFMVLACCTYTHLLFTFMMEQYVIAHFWLVLCVYLIAENYRSDRLAYWGASGTLMTSAVLIPFLSGKHPVKSFKAWFTDTVKYGLEFLALILVFCRFDVIFNFLSQITLLSTFTGKTVTFGDKLYQYTEFIRNCFSAPSAGSTTEPFNHLSWQLNAITGINYIGVAIMVLAVISAILNRDKKSSNLAIFWVAFSVIMLLGLGWGTMENGLILYSLYFGWAFFVLLFQLVEKIESIFKVKFITPILSAVCAVVLAAVNIPAIMQMIDFALTNFPA